MKFFNLLIGLLSICGLALAQDSCIVNMDMSQLDEGCVQVKISPPETNSEYVSIVFPIPSSPGSQQLYLIDFIKNFRALDADGKELSNHYPGYNEIIISEGDKLSSIEYQVCNIPARKLADMYVPGSFKLSEELSLINQHYFIGYLTGIPPHTYQISIAKPASIMNSPSGSPMAITDTLEQYHFDSYADLLENPMLYGKLDTTSFKVGTQRIRLTLFDEKGNIHLSALRSIMQPLVQDVFKFLEGAVLEDYHFMFYFSERKSADGDPRYGGLAHRHSSLYALPQPKNFGHLKSSIEKVACHEFLHILSPFQLHSDQFSNLSYVTSKELSQHFWLYEGAIEYLSWQLRVQTGRKDWLDFLDVFSLKQRRSNYYPKASLTELSRNLRKPKYAQAFKNFYHKGALAAWLLDIELMRLSNGEQGLREIMISLAQKYGHGQAFDDEQLFAEIAEMANADLTPFFAQIMDSKKPYPYEKYLEPIGVEFHKKHELEFGSFGDFELEADVKKRQLHFTNVKYNLLGVKSKDQLISINGSDIDFDDQEAIITAFQNPEPAEVVSIEVWRNGTIITLKAQAKVQKIELNEVFMPSDKATRNQLELRRKMLKAGD